MISHWFISINFLLRSTEEFSDILLDFCMKNYQTLLIKTFVKSLLKNAKLWMQLYNSEEACTTPARVSKHDNSLMCLHRSVPDANFTRLLFEYYSNHYYENHSQDFIQEYKKIYVKFLVSAIEKQRAAGVTKERLSSCLTP